MWPPHLAAYLPGHAIVKDGGARAIRPCSARAGSSARILLISSGYMKMLGRREDDDARDTRFLNANTIKSGWSVLMPVLYTRRRLVVSRTR